MAHKKSSKHRLANGFLDGQLLLAMPVMSDRRFQKTVIYMCAHSEDGAMGLILNQRAANISFTDLLERLGIPAGIGERGPSDALLARRVHVGGPVETGRGFVLHTSDYFTTDSTLAIHDGVCLTATVDILRAIASGDGPARSMLALGYSGWAAGQLESEIQANGWLHCPADPDIIFDTDVESKYLRALATLGIDPSHLVSDVGHA
jgi:putative transcriptional regulator